MSPFASFRPHAPARKTALASAIVAALATAPAVHAATFTEVADAGQTVATARVTTGAGALTDIFGSLLSSTDADLYVINITSPSTFSASTVNATGGFMDTQLFLFTMTGAPVYFNDDDAGGLSVLSTLSAGSSLGPTVAGMYILGVSLSGYDPINSNGQTLFAMGLSTATRGPASGLQPAFLGGFADNTYYTDSGPYDIKLTGAIAAVPEPASALLFLAGGALCAYGASRRRKAA